MKSIFVAAALTFASGFAYAGPFGLEMGAPLSELDVEENGSKTFLKNVPKPHPAFSRYFVWASEKTGVCLIAGLSKEYDNDRYGTKIRGDIDRFTTALDQKYGEHESVDFLKTGALWDEPNDWVMSVKQSERIFANFWKNPEGGAEENLGHIEMDVFALSSDNAVIRLYYKSNDMAECEAAISAEENGSF